MSGIFVRIAPVVCLLVFLYGRQSSAHFWHPAAVVDLPADPNDPYYDKFQTVPTTEVTATKFMTNFLGINPTNTRRKRRALRIDNVIVMDGSGSVGSCEFERGKAAIKNTMMIANEKRSDERYATVTFSNSASVNFKFLPYARALQELAKISFPGGGTNTQAGLAEAKTLFMDPSARRFVTHKTVLLITDGQSNIDQHLTIPNADKLKEMGVRIFVVAVGSYIDGIDEMVKVAGSDFLKPEDSLFRVQDYSGFLNVTKLAVRKAGSKYVSLSPYSSPC